MDYEIKIEIKIFQDNFLFLILFDNINYQSLQNKPDLICIQLKARLSQAN